MPIFAEKQTHRRGIVLRWYGDTVMCGKAMDTRIPIQKVYASNVAFNKQLQSHNQLSLITATVKRLL